MRLKLFFDEMEGHPNNRTANNATEKFLFPINMCTSYFS